MEKDISCRWWKGKKKARVDFKTKATVRDKEGQTIIKEQSNESI